MGNNTNYGDPCDPSSSSYDPSICTGGYGGTGNTDTPDTPHYWYLDSDGDGYEADTQYATSSPGAGWVEGASMGIDCDDNNPNIKQCNLPTPESVIPDPNCRCVDPSKKSNFSNVTNVANVLENKEWVPYHDNCNDSAKKQNEKSLLPNTTPVDGGYQENTFVDKTRQAQSGKTTPEINMQKAIDVVVKNLKAGKPVMAGVMYERYKGADGEPGGALGDNNNVATNHYVTIEGMGIDNGKPYFSYYDNYVSPNYSDGTPRAYSTLELLGTNVNENRFYYYKDSVGNYYFSDETAKTIDGPSHGYNNKYILTEIRDNF